jgi:hypothetical protein
MKKYLEQPWNKSLPLPTNIKKHPTSRDCFSSYTNGYVVARPIFNVACLSSIQGNDCPSWVISQLEEDVFKSPSLQTHIAVWPGQVSAIEVYYYYQYS